LEKETQMTLHLCMAVIKRRGPM